MSTHSPDSAAEPAAPRPSPRSRLVAGALVLGLGAIGIAALGPHLLDHAREAQVVSAADPGVRMHREIEAEFGFENPVVWVIEAEAGSIWTTPMLRRVAALTREVFTIPGVVATDVVSLASPNLRDLRVTEDSLEPVYLMAVVPETWEAVAALRARVEADPKYAGTITSRDGRAAMVVANFAPSADPRAVGAAVLALRDRHRDADAAVYATGGPVLAASAPRAMGALALPAALAALAGVVAFGLLAGFRHLAAAILAAALAVAATILAVGALGRLTAPWSLFVLPPLAFVAAGTAACGLSALRTAVVSACVVAAGFAGAAALVAPPASAFGVTGMIGVPLAGAAAAFARRLAGLGRTSVPRTRGRDVRPLARLLLAGSLFGLPALDAAFGTAGYGLRYLPGDAGADLRAVARLFPPPTTIAFRLRGTPGFVQDPAVLAALDAAVEAARGDGRVVSAMSLADLVKLVHRAFNDDDPAYERIPDDRALVARYLALAYSPGFRRFVDRAFARTAVWAYLASERPGDVARVAGRMQAALATHAPPGVAVDPPGGDGAVLLAMAATAGRLALAGLLVVVVVVLGLAIGLGGRAAARAGGSGLAAAAAAGGLLGWIGLPVDLLSLPALVGTAAACAAVAGLAASGTESERPLVLSLLCAGALAAAVPITLLRVIGVFLIAPAIGLGVVASRPLRAAEVAVGAAGRAAAAGVPHRGAA